MSKIRVTLDASKLRSLLTEREYTNREGQVVKVQEVSFELVPVKEPKLVKDFEKFTLMKTHFAAAIQTADQRAANEPTNYIGEGVTTQWKQDSAPINAIPVTGAQIVDPDDLPF